ncbi:MAG: hypothetical protein VX100_07330 [Pseudomonadota bacterium]|nr:hypothetical protein [Pseudomonadota bacterium]
MLKKIFVSVAVFASINASSLEPLPDRAIVQHMNANLLLPDNSILNVDMSFDCGSDYHQTGLIVSSRSGAELLAAAYTQLWGTSYGQSVIDAWENKARPNDPRKPTFLLVKTADNVSYNWSDNSNKVVKDDSLSRYEERTVRTISFKEDTSPPVLFQTCGTRNHDPLNNNK